MEIYLNFQWPLCATTRNWINNVVKPNLAEISTGNRFRFLTATDRARSATVPAPRASSVNFDPTLRNEVVWPIADTTGHLCVSDAHGRTMQRS